MDQAQVLDMLDGLEAALTAGPPGREREALRRTIEQVRTEQKPLSALVDGLRPLLRQVAVSTMRDNDIAGMRACRSVLMAMRTT